MPVTLQVIKTTTAQQKMMQLVPYMIMAVTLTTDPLVDMMLPEWSVLVRLVLDTSQGNLECVCREEISKGDRDGKFSRIKFFVCRLD